MNAYTLVNEIITAAIVAGASDVHFEPFENEMKVRFRIDGFLYDKEDIHKQNISQVISRIKIMSNLDIAERRVPQDGSARIKYNDIDVDLRISTMPVVYGEKIVTRILKKDISMIDFKNLGMEADDFEKYSSLLKMPYGMILVTGPTGSGKTTTLYSSLNYFDSTKINIMTIEDPVEYKLARINQTQVNYKSGLTFARGLRSILRQDPDVIMIGEIRDVETARIAVSAAMTGHLVFATLHTNDACSAIGRLLDMEIEPYFISSSVIGVVAQRLVRKLCLACNGVGCLSCNLSGFSGRVGIYELFSLNNEIRETIQKSHSDCDLKAEAKKIGMRTLMENGLKKVENGITNLSEIYRVCLTK